MQKIIVTFVCEAQIPNNIDINKLRGVNPGVLKIRHQDGQEFEVTPDTCYITRKAE